MVRLRILPSWEFCRIFVSQGFTEVTRRNGDVTMRKVRASDGDRDPSARLFRGLLLAEGVVRANRLESPGEVP